MALVTGASQGIGLEICRQLAQQDITVILTARNVNKGKIAVQKLQSAGWEVYFYPSCRCLYWNVLTTRKEDTETFGSRVTRQGKD